MLLERLSLLKSVILKFQWTGISTIDIRNFVVNVMKRLLVQKNRLGSSPAKIDNESFDSSIAKVQHDKESVLFHAACYFPSAEAFLGCEQERVLGEIATTLFE